MLKRNLADGSYLQKKHSVSTRWWLRCAVSGFTALVVPTLTVPQAMAVPLTTVSTTINSNFNYFSPTFQENLVIPLFETNNTGAPVQVTNFHAAGAPPGTPPGGAVDAPGEAHASGSADLGSGQLRARSQAKITREGTMFEQFAISSISTALFGDTFVTTTGSGNPYTWDGSGKGKFTIDLSGALFKDNQTGGDQSILEAGRTGFTVRLTIFGNNGEEGVCDWRRRVGGFDANEPFADTGLVQSSETTSNVCSNSGEIILGLGGSLRLEALVDVGADFDWLLSLATSTAVGSQLDEVEADFSNTLNVTYQGPGGTFTSADVFGAIVGSDPGDPNNPPVAVPAPPAFIMFGSGLVALCMLWRRRPYVA